MGKVFIPQLEVNDRRDISDLNRFGAPVIIFRDYVYPDEADERAQQIAETTRRALKGFQEDKDWIALIGSPIFIATCAYVLGGWGVTKISLLQYDRHERAYFDVTIPALIQEIDDDLGSRSD